MSLVRVTIAVKPMRRSTSAAGSSPPVPEPESNFAGCPHLSFRSHELWTRRNAPTDSCHPEWSVFGAPRSRSDHGVAKRGEPRDLRLRLANLSTAISPVPHAAAKPVHSIAYCLLPTPYSLAPTPCLFACPVDSRTTSSVSITISLANFFSRSAIRSSSTFAPRRPISSSGCRTVVIDGVV
jgi:hypothetical protein